MAFEKKAGAKAIVVYPQALPSDTAPFVGVNRWESNAASNDYPFFDAIVATVGGSHCLDTKRVFAAGFSNGAEFVSFLGCKRGAALRAIAPVAPGGPARVLQACTGDVAEWTGVGNQDPDHQVATLSVRDHYVTANGCTTATTPTTPAGCAAFNGCRAGLPVVFCTYDLGHAWPSIGSAGAWEFFNALP
jgi:poly(3-hydroxybutyrate) depolymerase